MTYDWDDFNTHPQGGDVVLLKDDSWVLMTSEDTGVELQLKGDDVVLHCMCGVTPGDVLECHKHTSVIIISNLLMGKY
jgi:hypothetical protein